MTPTDCSLDSKTLSTSHDIYATVAVPVPLHHVYSYRIPKNLIDDLSRLKPLTKNTLSGCRINVPFGKTSRIGVIISLTQTIDFDSAKVKDIVELIDYPSLINQSLFELADWASHYYHHPIGEVFKAFFPSYLDAKIKNITHYFINDDQQNNAINLLNRSPAQRAIYDFCLNHQQSHNDKITGELLSETFNHWRPAIKSLIEKQLIIAETTQDNKVITNHLNASGHYEDETSASFIHSPNHKKLSLNEGQSHCYQAILNQSHGFSKSTFKTFLLHGITGSGKTRIYLQLILDCIKEGKQCLVLVPEISLTPQLIERVEKTIECKVETLHSNKSANARHASWHNIRNGKSQILVGTRSAVFTPFKNLGLIIIDEEHDASYKQHDGFRFHARDVALVRAQKESIPIVLGSATPSLESMLNGETKYQYLPLLTRTGNAVLPKIHLIDLKSSPQRDGLTPHLIEAISNRLKKQEQSLIFLNRRGYAPVLMCGDCNWLAECTRCNAKLTLHHKKNPILNCHHCGSQRPKPLKCPSCNSEKLIAVGEGTQRLETHLNAIFPEARIARLDRDQTRTKGQLEDILTQINQHEVDIIIGTQMLSKGHDFPNVTLVGIVNPDGPLFSTDYRATENIMQLMIQVSGRSGRGDKQGVVIIQTAFPDNPYYQFVTHHDYNGFAKQVLSERKTNQLPPYSYMAIFRAEASGDASVSLNFLRQLHHFAQKVIDKHQLKNIEIYPPMPATMEKRQGRFRAQWIIISTKRNSRQFLIQNVLDNIETMTLSHKIRWSVDIDPLDMF